MKGTAPKDIDLVSCENEDTPCEYRVKATFLIDNKPVVPNLVARLGGLPTHAFKGTKADMLS